MDTFKLENEAWRLYLSLSSQLNACIFSNNSTYGYQRLKPAVVRSHDRYERRHELNSEFPGGFALFPSQPSGVLG